MSPFGTEGTFHLRLPTSAHWALPAFRTSRAIERGVWSDTLRPMIALRTAAVVSEATDRCRKLREDNTRGRRLTRCPPTPMDLYVRALAVPAWQWQRFRTHDKFSLNERGNWAEGFISQRHDRSGRGAAGIGSVRSGQSKAPQRAGLANLCENSRSLGP